MIKYLLDTNLFIAIFQGDARLKSFVESLACGLNTTVYAELIQYSRNSLETEKIEKYLTRFELIHFDKFISLKSINLVRTYSSGYNLSYTNAIIAATCIEKELILLTYNDKDFNFIKNLKVQRP